MLSHFLNLGMESNYQYSTKIDKETDIQKK